ncbi:restriction endonuclease subunit S [Salmonella enterica subsp. enterica]|nr:restriction endonuclease subunit S [Salmonella enterica]ECI4108927.1 restriction endonuclease subunit S [Salmonella enterica subsp. enterica]
MTVEKLIVEHIDTWTTALQTRSTAGRGSSGKIDLYGIKKLRELILELAVRGKLVPQDPNDEPASVLLERIAAEKAELVKQGKIKKPKPLPEISEEEKPFELPEGWEWARLGEAFYIEMGQSPSSQYYNQSEEGIPFFQGKADFGKKYPTARYWCTSPTKLAQKNDVLLSVRAPVGPTNLSPYHCCIGRGLAAIRCLSDAPHEYLLYILKASQRRLEELATGTTFVAVSKTDIEPLLMPIPPLNEQIRIVDTIDRLMSLCDQLEQHSLTSLDAHQQLVETLLTTLTDSQNADELAENWSRISEHFDTLFTTEASIDALKQAILQLAVMGKLVPQDPNDEPASELLKRIAQEKAQLVKDGKIKKQKPLPPISDEEKPFKLPEGWEWCQVNDIGDLKLGRQRSPKDHHGPYMTPYLRVANVHDNEIRTDDIKLMNFTPEEQTLYSLKFGDILLNEGQSLELVGRSAIFRDEIEQVCFQNTLIRLRANESVSNEYILEYFRYCLYSGRFQKAATQTTNIAHLSISRLAPIEFPLPPYKEQVRIVSKIKKLEILCENIKTKLKSAQQTQLHLADALTDAAIN